MSEKMIGFEIKTLSNLLLRYVLSELKKKNISFSPIQADIVCYLLEEQGKVYQKDLEDVFKLRRSTISGILKTMEKNDIIWKIDSSLDARRKEVVLTKRMLDMKEKMVQKSIDFDKYLKDGISDEDLNTFFRVIFLLKKKLEGKDD